MQALRERGCFSASGSRRSCRAWAWRSATGAGAALGSSVWAKRGAAKASRGQGGHAGDQKTHWNFSRAACDEGTVRPRYTGKMLWYLCHLCQILNRLQQLKSQSPCRPSSTSPCRSSAVILAGYSGRPLAHPGRRGDHGAATPSCSYLRPAGAVLRHPGAHPVAAVLDPALMLGFGAARGRDLRRRHGRRPGWSRGTCKGGLAAMSLQGIAASWGNVGYMGVPLCLRRLRRGRPAARHAGGHRDLDRRPWCSASC